MESQYTLEEYRILNSNVRSHGDKLFQLIIICLTAFGIIIGFTNKISDHYVPLAMLSVLWICLIAYRNYHRMHGSTVAIIINKYEKNIKELDYNLYRYKYGKFLRNQNHTHRFWLIKVLTTLTTSPFIVLTLILFGCYYYFGCNYVLEIMEEPDINHIFYLSLSLIGIVSILRNIYKIEKRGLDYFLNGFNEFNMSTANK